MRYLPNKIIMLLVLTIFSSCSTENNEGENEIKTAIVPDFFIDGAFIIHDMVTYNSEIYYLELAQEFTDEGVQINPIYIKRLQPDGTVTIINDILPFRSFTSTEDPGIEIFDGKPICVTDDNTSGNIIYGFNDDLDMVEETEINSLVNDDIAIFTSLVTYKDALIVYDKNAAALRGFDTNLEPNDFIAGNIEYNRVRDGLGENAGFLYISKIINVDDVLYAVDGSTHVRQIIETNGEIEVTTLFNTASLGTINDITFDSTTGDFFISIDDNRTGGLYTYNTTDETLNLVVDGVLSLDLTGFETNNDYTQIGLGTWGNIDHIHVDGEDLYFEQFDNIIKISDFRTKI